jgi:polyribonucleotide nucleotidyltransferase
LWPKGYKNETQVICTVLSADLITAHDILCINGASAALMVSPLPFLGPVGAVRVGSIDGELVVNPTLPEVEEQTELDLIVVGTFEGLTMVEAGANEVPEDRLLEALDLAQTEITRLCQAQLELRDKAGKAKWLDERVTEEIEREFGDEIRARIASEGLRGAEAVVEEALGELGMDSTEDDVLRQVQRKMSLATVLERMRLEAVLRPLREQFEPDLRTLTDAEQDSKELKSAKRQLLFDHIVESVQLPFPVGPAVADGEPTTVKDSLTKNFVKKAAEATYK